MAAVACCEPTPVTVKQLPIRLIRRNALQPRRVFQCHALDSLAESIREHGVLQAIIVRPVVGGQYEVIAGERRLRAAISAGLQTIPAVIRHAGNEDSLVLALVENLQREDMSPVETARAYKRLADEFGFSQAEIAHQVGKARATVANTLRLLQLPEEVLQALESGAITEGHARALLQLEGRARQVAACREAIIRGLSVRSVERIGRKPGQSNQREAELVSLAETLSERLGSPVEITGAQSGGMVSIRYFSPDDLERLVGRLGAQSL